MKIETYEIEEINSSEASAMAADSEALELIEKLGLSGQKGLIADTATRFQYPRLTKLQAVVFGTCFPVRTPLHQFRHEIIPLRVLQVAAFCKDFPQTQYLEVWHTAIPKQDQVLIGSSNSYSDERYLLARWADALPTFEELVEKARPILLATYRGRISKIKAHAEALERELDGAVTEALLTGEEPSFAVYD